MTTLPATTTSTGIAVPDTDPWAELRDTFDDGSKLFKEHFGLSLPRLRSDFGRNGKGWVDDLTGEVKDHFSGVILAYPPSRQFWLKSLDEGGSGPPDCRSIDMVGPDPSSPAVQASSCATCPHSQWTARDDGERLPPPCSESVNVIAHDNEDDVFVWLRFARTAIRPFKNYVSALAARRLPLFAVVTEIKLETKKEGSFEWLVPVFGMGETLTPDVVGPYREVAQFAMASFGQVVEEMNAAEVHAHDSTKGSDPFAGDGSIVDAEVVEAPLYDDEEPF